MAKTGGVVYQYTSNGVQSLLAFGSVPGAGVGLAFDNAGNLFAADSDGQTIYECLLLMERRASLPVHRHSILTKALVVWLSIVSAISSCQQWAASLQ